MYELIYEFFADTIFNADLELLTFQFYSKTDLVDGTIYTYSMNEWLCHTASIISITIIVVLCCLFVYKIIKLIGGLIR